MTDSTKDILAFQLGAERYGIDLMAVQEIRGYENVTRIANSPEFIKGVINLRGIIVPIIDLRMRFGTGQPTYDALTVVIILHVGAKVAGMVVDAVSDVVTLRENDVRPAPSMGGAISTVHMTGLASVDDHLVTLLDVPSLLASAEVNSIDEAFA